MTHTHEFLRGVNLGGWLIVEKWMTPSLFKDTSAVDEYTLASTKEGAKRLKKHRDTFITEADFKWLSKHGVNAVRIPIGYWVFEGDGPYVPVVKHLDWAIKTAAKYNILVLIDLHGAKGSQNGRDHSGKVGKSEWFRFGEYREQTIEVLEQLAARYRNAENVWGIELLNEPRFGIFHFKLRRFYKNAYKRVVKVARPGTTIVFHDAFTPRLMSGALNPIASYPIVMDVHWYQFATWFHKWFSLRRYFAKLQHKERYIDALQRPQPIIVGEWSAVVSSEALKGMTETQKVDAFMKHAELQLTAYQGTAGWFYWTYKTEAPGVWHFRSQVENGIISL